MEGRLANGGNVSLMEGRLASWREGKVSLMEGRLANGGNVSLMERRLASWREG